VKKLYLAFGFIGMKLGLPHKGETWAEVDAEWGVEGGGYLGLRGRKLKEAGENCLMTSFLICAEHQTVRGRSHEE